MSLNEERAKILSGYTNHGQETLWANEILGKEHNEPNHMQVVDTSLNKDVNYP